MSTRANFIVVSPDQKICQFYNHCDGYPKGLGNALKTQVLIAIGKSFVDRENLFIEKEVLYKEFMDIITCKTDVVTDFIHDYEPDGNELGLDDLNHFHSDIEYLYVVDFSQKYSNRTGDVFGFGCWRKIQRDMTYRQIVELICKPEFSLFSVALA